MTKPFITSLPEWGLIHAHGADAATFLHGQLTNDLLHLAPGTVQWNGYCTAKGRMLASFLVWRDGGDGFFLATDKALTPALTKRLRMFVLRAKVVIDDASDAFAAFGMARAGAADAADAAGTANAADATDADPAANAMHVIHDAAAWHVTLAPANGLVRTLAYVPASTAGGYASTQSLTTGDAGDWTRLMIHAGEAWVTPATQEAFVPQMINFDAIGGINFKKGCYPGQEIVARAHYRGAVKRRMYRAEVDAPVKAGDALFGSAVDGQECGIIALAAPPDATAHGSAHDVLAVVQMQSQAEGEVRLGAPDGPLLRFTALPYAIPEPL